MAIIRRKPRGEPPIPTDSISDIAFLLIIFFILTTAMKKFTGFQTDFPSAEADVQKAQKNTTVRLESEQITFNDDAVDFAELRTRLADLELHKKSVDEKVVVLEAQGAVTWQRYFEVWSAITASGGTASIVRKEE